MFVVARGPVKGFHVKRMHSTVPLRSTYKFHACKIIINCGGVAGLAWDEFAFGDINIFSPFRR